MEVVALHTRLVPGCIEEYEFVHAVIPPELDTALRCAGVKSWRIWRDGLDLLHWVEVEDFKTMKAMLKADPADQVWQERISRLLQTQDSYTDSDMGLPLVWELPVRPAEL